MRKQISNDTHADAGFSDHLVNLKDISLLGFHVLILHVPLSKGILVETLDTSIDVASELAILEIYFCAERRREDLAASAADMVAILMVDAAVGASIFRAHYSLVNYVVTASVAVSFKPNTTLFRQVARDFRSLLRFFIHTNHLAQVRSRH